MAVEETPGNWAAVVEETPGNRGVVEETPGNRAVVEETPGNRAAVVEETPGNRVVVEENLGMRGFQINSGEGPEYREETRGSCPYLAHYQFRCLDSLPLESLPQVAHHHYQHSLSFSPSHLNSCFQYIPKQPMYIIIL